MRKLMILWGVPGSGKSAYARWLGAHKDFAHAETDIDAQTAINLALRMPPDGHPVVLEWGMFVQAATVESVRELQAQGADPWWFDGDREAAFQAWKKENRRLGRSFTDDLWHRVVDQIDARWGLVEGLFGQSRILQIVSPGPKHLAGPEIWALMEERRR